MANPSVGLTDRDMLASTKNLQPRYGAIAHGVGALGSLVNRSIPDTRNLTLATTRHAVVEILGSMCSRTRGTTWATQAASGKCGTASEGRNVPGAPVFLTGLGSDEPVRPPVSAGTDRSVHRSLLISTGLLLK